MTTTSTRGPVLRLAGLVAVLLLAACSSQAQRDPAAHAATSAPTATVAAPAVANAERPADAVAATAAVVVVWQGSGDLLRDLPSLRMRNSGWRGTLHISAPDVDLRGTINAVLDFDVTTLGNGETTHQWGTVEANLDGASCEGNVGNTDVPSDEDDDDGAFVLTCEDGSALFGRVHDWADREGSNDFTVSFELDGWYLPSAAA